MNRSFKRVLAAFLALTAAFALTSCAFSAGIVPNDSKPTAEATAEPTSEATEAPAAEPTVEATSGDVSEVSEAELAYRVYKDAIDKTNGLSDLHMITDVNQNMEIFANGEETVTAKTVTRIDTKQKNMYTDNVLFEMRYTQTLPFAAVTEIFADGDNVYFRTDTTAAFTKVPRTDPSVATINDSLSKNNDVYYPEEAFANAKVTESTTGTKTIKFRPTDETMNTIFDDTIKTILSSLESTGASDITYLITNGELSFTVTPEGYIRYTESRIDLTLKMYVAGTDTTVKSDVYTFIEYKDLGQPVEIVIPSAD